MPFGPPLYMYAVFAEVLGELTDSFFIEGVSDPKTLMIIADKDNLRQNHIQGPTVTAAGGLQGVQYWDQFNATPALANLTPASGKEILVTFRTIKVAGTTGDTNFRVWAGGTFGSKTGARDVFGADEVAGPSTGSIVSHPPFILQAGEFFTIENSHASRTFAIESLVAVERDET